MTPITAVVVYFSIRPVTKAPWNRKDYRKIRQLLFGVRQTFFQIAQILLYQGKQIEMKYSLPYK